MTRNRGRLSSSLMRWVGNLRVPNANRSGGSSQLVSRIIRMWTFTFLARGGRVAMRDFAKIGFVDVLDIGKHDESMRVWRGENRQSPERHSPKRKEYNGMQVLYWGTGRRKLASVEAAFVSRLSQVDRFSSCNTTEVRNLRLFLQQAMLVLPLRVAIGLREGWAQGLLEEGEALYELKTSIIGPNKGLAKRVATDLLGRNRSRVTCKGDSITAINLSVSICQAKFQKVW